MKLVDMKVTEFLDELASKSPAPGGGSVSALAGANAASLILMVGALTTKKKKFLALSDEIQSEYINLLIEFETAKQQFIKFVDEDTQAFNLVMDAFKMPKETDSEKMARNQAIEKATIASIKTPMEVAVLALGLLRKLEAIIKNANRNTTSDQGVALLLLETALNGALMNVKINLPGLSDKSLVKDYNKVIVEMTNESNEIRDRLLEQINYLLD